MFQGGLPKESRRKLNIKNIPREDTKKKTQVWEKEPSEQTPERSCASAVTMGFLLP